MPIEDLLERLMTVPDTSMRVVLSRDDFHGVSRGADIGYCAQVTVKGSVLSSRGLTINEACSILTQKINAKYPV